jgi:hypothetical protein
MLNFLEQLAAEWFELNGYFVRRNIHVGLRENRGGYECELDVIAFNPKERHLIHIEPSMDSYSWNTRETRFKKKFSAGKKYIPKLFEGFDDLPNIESVALLVYGSGRDRKTIGGGEVWMIGDFLQKVRVGIKKRSISKNGIPEQYVILRAMLFAHTYWK